MEPSGFIGSLIAVSYTHLIEGQRIKAHPEYKLEKRLLLDKIDLNDGTVEVEGVKWPCLLYTSRCV